MSLVHYYPGDSFFHKLDPRVKMLWLACMFVLSFIFNHPLHLGVLFISVLFLWIYMKIPFSELKLFFKALTIVAIVTFFFESSIMLLGTLAPPVAIAFLHPYLSRLSTSARPSTIIISSDFKRSGPHTSLSGPQKAGAQTKSPYPLSPMKP